MRKMNKRRDTLEEEGKKDESRKNEISGRKRAERKISIGRRE